MRFLRMLTNSLLAGALGAAFSPSSCCSSTRRATRVQHDVAALRHARALLRRPPRGRLLPADGRARVLRPRRHVPGMGERPRARLALAGIVRGGVGADVVQRQWLSGGARRDRGAADDARGAAATTATAVVLARHWRRRTTRSAAAAAAWAPSARDRGLWIAGAAGRCARSRASRHRPAPHGDTAGAAAAPRAGPRVTLLLLDGASLDYIWPRAADGRLPNFARLIENGASIDLATIRPTEPGSGLGRRRDRHVSLRRTASGRREFYVRGDIAAFDLLPDYCFSHVLVHLGFVRDVNRTLGALRARPLWSDPRRRRASRRHRPLAADVSGAAVRAASSLSDRFHQLARIDLRIRSRVPAIRRHPADRSEAFADRRPGRRRSASRLGARPRHRKRRRLRRDRFYSRAMRDLARGSGPCSCRRCATRGSTPSGTTTCATRSRATSARRTEEDRRRFAAR